MPEPVAPPIAAKPTSTPAEGDQCVTLRDVGWMGYKLLLRLRGERNVPKLIYLDGSVTLVSPAWPHESRSHRLGRIIEEVAFGCDLPLLVVRQTTIWRKKGKAGSEADEAYYLANEARMIGKSEIDLRVDPPPDLVVEVVHTHGAAAAVLAWKRLRVPEIWVDDHDALHFLVRRPNGRYVESPTSLAFPILSSPEVRDWVDRPITVPLSEWTRGLRAWVRDVIAPRARGGRA